MAHVVIQAGHYDRKKGSTGTYREQEFTSTLAPKIVRAIELGRWHTAEWIYADAPIPECDIFISLHCDGSSNVNARGASFGWPDETAVESAKLGEWFQDLYEYWGYDGGFRRPNYTDNLRYYYSWRKVNATVEILVEHGFNTNEEDLAYVFGNIDRIAAIHAAAVALYLGTPEPKPAPVLIDFDAMASELKAADWYSGSIPVTDIEALAMSIREAQAHVGHKVTGAWSDELHELLSTPEGRKPKPAPKSPLPPAEPAIGQYPKPLPRTEPAINSAEPVQDKPARQPDPAPGTRDPEPEVSPQTEAAKRLAVSTALAAMIIGALERWAGIPLEAFLSVGVTSAVHYTLLQVEKRFPSVSIFRLVSKKVLAPHQSLPSADGPNER